ncbi:RING finger protein 17 isoform X2 [Syngnathus scovelli]|uniref:RING finger protein 17 isoform X2 n=1 Tax=Syngnathus scovelli TaxID=161590 RepID=UPI00210F7F9B|nr:RING finger protein 17 isoform X2 [Syngnathus scovelli]
MEQPNSIICKFCGNAYTLPENQSEGNLPRTLVCGHIFCTSCLESMNCDNVVQCPECEVDSVLPQDGVFGLQEDSRIIGIVYTTRINKMKRLDKSNNRKKQAQSSDISDNTVDAMQPVNLEKSTKAVDEALATAAEHLAMLEYLDQTLNAGLAEQVKTEQARLEMEISQAADRAMRATQKWRNMQLSKLSGLDVHFTSTHAELCKVKARMDVLGNAVQKAKNVQSMPLLKHCTDLDKILETLQAPIDKESFNMKCITMGCGVSVMFRSKGGNQSVDLFLKMDTGKPNSLSVVPRLQQLSSEVAQQPPGQAHVQSLAGSDGHGRAKSPLRSRNQRMSPSRSPASRCRSLTPTRGSSCYNSKASSQVDATPDVIVKEFIETQNQHVSAGAPPTGPELAKDKRRSRRRGSSHLSGQTKNVAQKVVVTHVVNPTHFYVRYVAKKQESDILSKEINTFCTLDASCFSTADNVQNGSIVLAKGKEGLWCRTRVLSVFQSGRDSSVEICPVDQLGHIRIFFIDYGYTNSLTIERDVSSVNNHLRKINRELVRFAPQAVRCSLKGLVPYDLSKGWSNQAQRAFCKVVGSAVVEMSSFGQDRDSLLVDLSKDPVGPSNDVPISIRDYLVFTEVARFYYPVKPSRRPLKYYSAVVPKINVEHNVVVTHINSPDDFYIQLSDNMESSLLKARLQECYNDKNAEESLLLYCPVIGQACVARFDENMWYRAEVIGNPGYRKVDVFCIDMGFMTTVLVSDLRKIKDEFFYLPALAIQCCLSDVLPLAGETWSDACVKRFNSLTHGKLFTIAITVKSSKKTPLPVKLLESSPTDSPTNIAEVLIQEQLVCSKTGFKTNMVADDAIWDSPLELNGLGPLELNAHAEVEFQPRLNLPGSLKDAKVRVSHINSPSSFYVQFVNNDSQLKRLNELLKKERELAKLQDVVWKSNMFCAARVNQIWERGLICSDVSSDDIAEVMRCDHGNKVKLHVSNLQPLPASLEGSFALECSLTDIKPAGGQPTWTATACDFMHRNLSGASGLITIQELTDERPVAVTLMCTNKTGEFVNVSDYLAYEGLALRERKSVELSVPPEKPNETEAHPCDTNKQAETPTQAAPPLPAYISKLYHPRPAPRTIRAVEKVQTDLYKTPELPQLGHNHMTISAVREDGLIYARTDTAECHLENLRKKIHQRMKTLPNQKLYTWKTVKGCAVIGPDMLWYRGQLLEVLGGHVKVQYVDYGLMENIPVVHVYPRLLCEDIPQLCVACQLHATNPIGGIWHQDAIELLTEMLLDRRVDVNVLMLPTDPRQPLTVEIFLDGLSLSTILCNHKHALFDQNTPPAPPLPPVPILDIWDIDTEGLLGPREVMLGPFTEPDLPKEGEHLNVRVKHLQTPNEVFLFWEDMAHETVDGETLQECITRINADVLGLLPLTSFPLGGPCLAEYSDGIYYRAKMLEIISAEPVQILIQHVDFGSNDTLPSNMLRQMPAELLRFPFQALKVHLAGFKAPSIQTEDQVLPYCPEWSIKATQAMIDLLHGDLIAEFKYDDASAEPSVLLYNQEGHAVFLPLLASGLAQLD